jgi:predicted enzyme related to lactoylglutathione lyase
MSGAQTTSPRIVDAHAAGAPAWVGLASNDVPAAKDFYATLFNWTFVDEPLGRLVHTTCLLDGERVAGITPTEFTTTSFHGWLTYLAIADIDTGLARAVELGGQIVAPAREYRAAGTVAVIRDPQGALVALYEPGARTGARRLNDAGALCWNELNTQDPDGSKRFYEQLFGYEEFELETPGGARYDVLTLDGHPALGVLGLEPGLIPLIPARWLAYFSVSDLDAALQAVLALGGTIVIRPSRTRHGRSAVVRDPQGAAFCMSELSEPLR